MCVCVCVCIDIYIYHAYGIYLDTYDTHIYISTHTHTHTHVYMYAGPTQPPAALHDLLGAPQALALPEPNPTRRRGTRPSRRHTF